MSLLLDRPDRLTDRIRAVRDALAHAGQRASDSIEWRVAVSVAHLGLIARLLAPALGATALGLTRLRFGVPDLWWQDALGGPYPLSVATSSTAAPANDRSAVDAITIAIADRYRIAPRVLWGNVASAVNSAARLVATARPELTAVTYRAADAILADPRIEDGAPRVGPDFRRRSCCLIYRLAATGTAVCGDCVLTRDDR